MSQGRGETILVVEDDGTVLRLVRVILTEAGYHVLSTESAVEAIEMAQRKDSSIHLLITDVVMPEMTGKELAESISAIRPDVKTLFMSGYARIATLHYSVLEKGVHFIEKPFTPDRLISKVREV